jgi:hypothetical protein
MTIIAGCNIHATPCCGSRYSTPNYRSMNFSAWEYWTDGWREDSLMPNDEGLRRCQCGQLYLLSELIHLERVEDTDLPPTTTVPDDQLATAIGQAKNPAVERAARLMYWRVLNQPYREQYRAHRDAEEKASEAAWREQNPDRRTWWQRLRNVPPPRYKPQPGRPFTYPAFEPTEEQRDNMKALLPLINPDEGIWLNWCTVAELHRELGEFEEAAAALKEVKEPDVTSRLIGRLVNERQPAPMRYRM